MAGFYDSNKTGQQVDEILDNVITDIDVNPYEEPTDWFDGIKVGNNIYKLIGTASPSVAKLYKHTFEFTTTSGTFDCVGISPYNNGYTTIGGILDSFGSFATLKFEGLTVVSVNTDTYEYFAVYKGALAKVATGGYSTALANYKIEVY